MSRLSPNRAQIADSLFFSLKHGENDLFLALQALPGITIKDANSITTVLTEFTLIFTIHRRRDRFSNLAFSNKLVCTKSATNTFSLMHESF